MAFCLKLQLAYPFIHSFDFFIFIRQQLLLPIYLFDSDVQSVQSFPVTFSVGLLLAAALQLFSSSEGSWPFNSETCASNAAIFRPFRFQFLTVGIHLVDIA